CISAHTYAVIGILSVRLAGSMAPGGVSRYPAARPAVLSGACPFTEKQRVTPFGQADVCSGVGLAGAASLVVLATTPGATVTGNRGAQQTLRGSEAQLADAVPPWHGDVAVHRRRGQHLAVGGRPGGYGRCFGPS